MAKQKRERNFFKRWARSSSIWPVRYCVACCSTEMAAAMASRFDMERYGVMPVWGPRQADFLMIGGIVTKKTAPRLKTIYEQMPEPKYVLALGGCTSGGGPYWDSYNAVQDVSTVVPVDVYIPGCPPRPEAILRGIEMVQEMIRKGIRTDEPMLVTEKTKIKEVIESR
jgi:NADH-quinone oxidoreductase subunit B